MICPRCGCFFCPDYADTQPEPKVYCSACDGRPVAGEAVSPPTAPDRGER